MLILNGAPRRILNNQNTSKLTNYSLIPFFWAATDRDWMKINNFIYKRYLNLRFLEYFRNNFDQKSIFFIENPINWLKYDDYSYLLHVYSFLLKISPPRDPSALKIYFAAFLAVCITVLYLKYFKRNAK